MKLERISKDLCGGRGLEMKQRTIMKNIDCFQIDQILESGQVFRFTKIAPSQYFLIVKERAIQIEQKGDTIYIDNMSLGKSDDKWLSYFDINTDYSCITRLLSQKDDFMKKAIEFGKGIRLLRQDPWEMLISFIISQNKSIPQIKQCISNICTRFGTKVTDQSDNILYYTFPSIEQLKEASEDELRACKVGFRAPYIVDAAKRVYQKNIVLDTLFNISADDARKELMSIKGVGPKIADCILLFAYAKGEVFPTDVWIKRVVEHIYFKGEDTKLQTIQEFAKEYFGAFAGYAQQYIFFYGRENKLFI